MRQLFPDEREVGVADLAVEYLREQRPHSADRPFIRVNMVASLDGVTRGASGTSADVSGAEDREMLLMLRACADAVLVGASTVRAYPYRAPSAQPRWQQLREQAGLGPAPRLVIVSSRGLAADNPCFADRANPPLVVVAGSCEETALSSMRGAGAQVLRLGDGPDDRGVDMHDLLAALHDAGLSRIVCEGGPSLLSQLSDAGLIDELCLTTSPVWLG
ncbi:MAG: pyrimidine reductase family protein, partial [Actinobacteria bacterium]|nr:pyrimidine reductase family protein [Actinomycetota bacterium]